MTAPANPFTTDPVPASAPAPATSLRRMCWIFPDRESTATAASWQHIFWDLYADVAAGLGLAWTRHAPDAVTVDGTIPGAPQVYVDRELVTPEDTLFITALYSLPYQSMDIFNQYAVYTVLEQCGFYLPFPPQMSLIGNDKMATLLYLGGSPVPPIPSVRIGTGRDVAKHAYEVALTTMTYPAIVKPVGWCGGGGVNLARTPDDIRGLASLAQGGDTTLVVQPYLGDGTVDYRVYVIDGEPYAVLRRTPEAGSPVANNSRGGSMELSSTVPEELAAATAYFAERLPIPYFCVDFLFDGERFWFSEFEPDGVVAPDLEAEGRPLQRDITRARFTAYRDAHAKWLADGPARSAVVFPVDSRADSRAAGPVGSPADSVTAHHPAHHHPEGRTSP